MRHGRKFNANERTARNNNLLDIYIYFHIFFLSLFLYRDISDISLHFLFSTITFSMCTCTPFEYIFGNYFNMQSIFCDNNLENLIHTHFILFSFFFETKLNHFTRLPIDFSQSLLHIYTYINFCPMN